MRKLLLNRKKKTIFFWCIFLLAVLLAVVFGFGLINRWHKASLSSDTPNVRQVVRVSSSQQTFSELRSPLFPVGLPLPEENEIQIIRGHSGGTEAALVKTAERTYYTRQSPQNVYGEFKKYFVDHNWKISLDSSSDQHTLLAVANGGMVGKIEIVKVSETSEFSAEVTITFTKL